MGPMYSAGHMMRARTYGSCTSSITTAGGMSAGFSTSNSVPSVLVTWYSTLGTVVTRSRSYSRSSRSCTISMCRSPRNPQRKPKPSAVDVSGSYCSDASLSFIFSSASRSVSYCVVSVG